ncbi:MAG TPA: BatA domain-containing protein [Planctomycetota bacterium]|nr:BatA domain-containing protein [Planctomycetota bacterium]
MIAISFVHPALLGGLALASLPIIIHLLNRRRFKTMEWAAMDFLLKAAVRNRRRVRLENLLLLLLRTALVVLLILAVARPFSPRQDALAALFGAAGSTERILLLDDSHSMRAGQGNRSAFETAKALAKRLVERLHDERSSDRLTLLLGTRPRDAEEGFRRVSVASAHGPRLAKAIEGLQPSDGTLDVVAAVDALLADREEHEARLVVHILSDFRRRDWAEASGDLRPDVVKALAALAERADVRLIDVGAAPVDNVGVVGLEPIDRAVIAGVPATFVARVRNYGPGPASNVTVQFEFGTHQQVPVRVEGDIPPGGEPVEVKTEYTFRSAGPAVVRARTPADLLSGDDVRRRVVSVRPRLRFLLVDGEPEPEAYRGETDFLAAALMPPGDVPSGIEVDVVADSMFPGRDPDAYDGIFLCNVYRLPDDRVKALEDYVRAGGGVIFFLGDQVDPQVYNAIFFGRGEEAGQHLLPYPLRDVEGSSDEYTNLMPSAPDHPAVRFLRGLHPVVFRTVAVSRFVKCEVSSRADARVLLSYTDEDGSPALVEKQLGDGRVLLFTTAADLEWSNFPHSVLWLPLLQEAARYVVRRDPDIYTKTVGEPIVIRYEPREMAPLVAVVPPPELGGTPVQLASARDEATKQLFYRFDRTTVAGEYAVRLKTPQGEPYEELYAMNLDPTEGDLERVDLEKLRAAAPGARIERGAEGAALGSDEADRSEFWRTLVVALVAVASLETLLAWRFGHHAAKRVEAEGKQVFVR